MKLRSLALSLVIATLLAPAALLAADTASDTAATAATTAKAEAVAKRKASAPCDRVSGSIIVPSRKNGCKPTALPFRTYTPEDLQRTGEIDINEALRKVDTIFQ